MKKRKARILAGCLALYQLAFILPELIAPRGLAADDSRRSFAQGPGLFAAAKNPERPAGTGQKTAKEGFFTRTFNWTGADKKVKRVAFALAKDQVVVAHQAGAAYKVTGFRRADGSKAWAVDLPDQPAMNRLAVDRDGRVIVSLCDGSVVCLGR